MAQDPRPRPQSRNSFLPKNLPQERWGLLMPAAVALALLLLQGADDAVVPPSQSEAIRDALAARGVPHEYVLFPGEGHGFRQAETIIAAAEAELRFLGKVFGFAATP